MSSSIKISLTIINLTTKQQSVFVNFLGTPTNLNLSPSTEFARESYDVIKGNTTVVITDGRSSFVKDFPAPEAGVYYIVSRKAKDLLFYRSDVLAEN